MFSTPHQQWPLIRLPNLKRSECVTERSRGILEYYRCRNILYIYTVG
ncbi:hypothetical protein CPT_Spivey_010 [Klebsiella phage Spivey]|uniref:Uncharacterized protein n=1 Tax=Klebsiella phage Spivey TaxID=2562542 RepID=A0A4D5ZDE3_9CAUD|nr:hypothetical protein CPT_Spivey_013 [Klebsiella phage Spivey]